MASDVAAEIPRMAEAFGLVTCGAVPVGLACAALSRWRIFTRWKPLRSPWSGVDILFLYCLHPVLPMVAAAILGITSFDAAAAAGGTASGVAAGLMERQLFGMLRASAVGGLVLLGIAAGLRWFVHPKPPRASFNRIFPDIALGVGVWLAVTPVVFVVNFMVAAAVGEPDDHPFTRGDIAGDPALLALFTVTVCGLTPLVEEFLFRGMLVGWIAERRGRFPAVLLAGVVYAALFGGLIAKRPEAVGFAVLLAAGGLLVRRRTTLAIYATSVLFAVAHSAVWPSPVPLFVLAIALGWLTARTGGIVAATVTHALFNAVSFVYLLRGGG